MDGAAPGNSLKSFMVATGFRKPGRVDAGTAARWLRHTLEQLQANEGDYRAVNKTVKRDWHRLLEYNRRDCEGLKYVWQRATRELELELEKAYRATTAE